MPQAIVRLSPNAERWFLTYIAALAEENPAAARKILARLEKLKEDLAQFPEDGTRPDPRLSPYRHATAHTDGACPQGRRGDRRNPARKAKRRPSAFRPQERQRKSVGKTGKAGAKPRLLILWNGSITPGSS
jgi:plasmid stabilization system protein ParE